MNGIVNALSSENITYGQGSVKDALDGLQEWSDEVDVSVTDGHLFFSKHPIGLKRGKDGIIG